ncbi:MAG: methyltransferase domain-containing protein [Candidatus Eremiobacteraeota bacterium]|nr:methyltransferase domain-containing protein [Candidatus Eremiobacteraeota bacterium]
MIDALAGAPAHVLDVGTGSGRNARAIRAAGFDVDAIEDTHVASGLPCCADTNYDAIISTHAFLHGDTSDAARNVAAARAALRAGGLLYATFASYRDARFGKGTKVDAQTFSPHEGDETGVPHVYFEEAQLRALLQPAFEIDSIEEHDADTIVGRWAHVAPSGIVHWFVRARAKDQ